MINVIRRGVASIRKTGGTPLTGDVTLSEGTGLTITQVGSDLSLSAAGGAPSGPASGELTGTYPNPTVVASHSGTTHAATEAAAEATAAAALVIHAATPHGGAPADADYLVGTANGGLSAEIVVGTTPGGELGGTWASPTVDGTHSGSAHHALVTLAADADTLLGLSGQDISLDSQAANAVLAGPVSGGSADPTFRALVDADIPAAIARDSELITTHGGLTGVTSDQHHAQAHTLVSHSTRPHSDLTAIGADDHHAQAHHAAHEPSGADPMAVDAAAATGSLRTLGSGAAQAVSGTDSRLSDARTPTAHHGTHEPNGSDHLVAGTGSYASGSLTIPTGQWALVVQKIVLTGSQSVTANGTAILKGIS